MLPEVESVRGEAAQVAALGQVLAQESVCVLVDAALPRAVRIGEVGLNVGGSFVTVKLVLMRLRTLSVGIVLALGLAACIAAPRIVGPIHPAIPPSKVRVFISPIIPRHYTVVAKLDRAWYGGCDSPGLDRIILAKFRKQAAHLGANGILLVMSKRVTSGGRYCFFPQPWAKAVEAIDVPSPKSSR